MYFAYSALCGMVLLSGHILLTVVPIIIIIIVVVIMQSEVRLRLALFAV